MTSLDNPYATRSLSAGPPPIENRKSKIENLPSTLLSFLLYATLISLALVFALPLLYAISASLKTRDMVFEQPPRWIPSPFAPENYYTAFTVLPFPTYILNTFVITELCVIGTVFSSSFVAYGFARFNFPFKKTLFAILIGTILLPGQVTQIPVFLIWRQLGLINSIIPLTLGSFLGGGAFNIFLLRQFYSTIPKSLDEAAMIDGCTPFGIWWRIMLPLSKPALITVAIFSFTGAWDDFMGPLIYLQDSSKYTVSVGLQLFNDEFGGSQLNVLMAAAIVHIIPVFILFLFAQRYFIRGIVTSGSKE